MWAAPQDKLDEGGTNRVLAGLKILLVQIENILNKMIDLACESHDDHHFFGPINRQF